MDPIISGVLLLCAFMTLFAVSAACLVVVTCIALFAKQNKWLDRELATIQHRTAKAISEAVAEFVQPYREAMSGGGRAKVQPMPYRDELEEMDDEEKRVWLAG